KSKAASAQGSVVKQVPPNVAASARATIEGKIKVRVRVDVDAAGKVTDTKLVTRGPSKYFARVALEAAQEWEFSAPKVEGQGVPSQWILQFGFRRGGTDLSSSQKSP